MLRFIGLHYSLNPNSARISFRVLGDAASVSRLSRSRCVLEIALIKLHHGLRRIFRSNCRGFRNLVIDAKSISSSSSISSRN